VSFSLFPLFRILYALSVHASLFHTPAHTFSLYLSSLSVFILLCRLLSRSFACSLSCCHPYSRSLCAHAAVKTKDEQWAQVVESLRDAESVMSPHMSVTSSDTTAKTKQEREIESTHQLQEGIYIHICEHILMLVCVFIYTCIHIYIYIIYMHTYMYVYIYTYIYIYIYI